MTSKSERRASELRVGDLVEVLSAGEILAGSPTRPRARDSSFFHAPRCSSFVASACPCTEAAHKLCEIITGNGRMHWMNNAVHLVGASCTGLAHGGCQAACSLYWKEAGYGEYPVGAVRNPSLLSPLLARCASTRRQSNGRRRNNLTRMEPNASRCQATEILRAAPGTDPFLECTEPCLVDLRSGNASVLAVTKSLLFRLFNIYQVLEPACSPATLALGKGRAEMGFRQGSRVRTNANGSPSDLQVGEARSRQVEG